MADDADRAQEINEQLQSDILERRIFRSFERLETRTHCIDCEEEIPLKRQIAVPGVQRCIDCQKDYEHRR